MPNDGFYAGHAPRVIVKNENIKRIMDEVVQLWIKVRPLEVSAFVQFLDAERRKNPAGRIWTRNRRFMEKGHIPSFVYHGIGRAIGCPDWILDESMRKTFWKVFQIGDLAPMSLQGNLGYDAS